MGAARCSARALRSVVGVALMRCSSWDLVGSGVGAVWRGTAVRVTVSRFLALRVGRWLHLGAACRMSAGRRICAWLEVVSASQGAALPAKWNGALLVTVMVSVLGPGRRLVMVWNHREVHVGLVWMRSRWVVAVMWRWPWGRHWAAASVRACRRAFRRPIAAAAATAVNMRGPP